MSPGRRFELAVEMCEAAREVSRAGIRSRHPDYRASDVEHALFPMLLGDDSVPPRLAEPPAARSMSTAALLQRLRAALDAAGIPFMLVGSFASTLYGHPRTTQDIDVVIAPTEPTLARFLAMLSSDDYYVSDEAARDAFRRRGMFNLIDHETGWKIDLIVRKDRPFSVEEFGRRSTQQLFGLELPVASPEDTILAKLEWAAAGESERQLRDVENILSVAGEELDLAYIERWARELGVDEVWRRLFSSSQMG